MESIFDITCPEEPNTQKTFCVIHRCCKDCDFRFEMFRTRENAEKYLLERKTLKHQKVRIWGKEWWAIKNDYSGSHQRWSSDVKEMKRHSRN